MEQIIIQGVTFNVPTPYAEGHVLAANEASALNQLLHENLRNNFASKVKAARGEDPDRNLNPDEVQSLQEALDVYAAGYEFGVRSVRSSSGPSLSAVDREAISLAKAAIKAALKKKGYDVKSLDKEDLEAKAAELIDRRPEFREQAQARVAAKKAAAATSLDDILG
jgi:hypothetical protein